MTNGTGTITAARYAIRARTGSVTLSGNNGAGNNGIIEAKGTNSTAIYALTDANVTNGAGTITGGSFAIRAQTGSVTLGGNNGLIEARGTNGYAIRAAGDAIITNSKTIQALAAGGYAIKAGSNVTVEANGAGGDIAGDATAIYATGNITVKGNNGLIEAKGGNGTAIFTGSGAVTVTNGSGTIQATAAGGSAIFAGTAGTVTLEANGVGGDIAGYSTAILAGGSVMVKGNNGTIEATGTNINSYAILARDFTVETNNAGGVIAGDAKAIFATGNVTVKGNNGLIEATGTTGMAIYSRADAMITNNTGGVIQATGLGGRAIYAFGDATITNGLGGVIQATGAAGIGVLGEWQWHDLQRRHDCGRRGRLCGEVQRRRHQFADADDRLDADRRVVGSTVAGATNNLVLTGDGVADSNFLNFTSLDAQAGAGHTWLWNTDATINGAAQVSSGTLVIGDAAHGVGGMNPAMLNTAGLTVQSAGLLGGAGTVNGDVNINGVVHPGVFNALSTLTVNGKVTFAPGSVFRVSINDANVSDRLNVTGAASTVTLNGATVDVVPTQQLTIGTTKTYTSILHADAGSLGNGGMCSAPP